MYHIVYVSSAESKFSEKELLSILDGARKTNERLGITGLMVYIDGNIIQLLEGEENDVNTLFAKIALDTRHTGIIKLLSGPLAKRNFDDWSMQFKSLSYQEAEQISGYKNLDKESFLEHSTGGVHPGLKVINAFCKTNLR
jgi:Sensors of blue-light using FAD